MEPITLTREIPASVAEVWRAWTTSAGITSFFAPQAWVDLRVGGPFEMYFLLEEPPGSRGAEGCRILAYVPERMLAFSWNNPPHLAAIRFDYTWVTLFFEARGETTHLELVQQGWGDTPIWAESHAYFTAAWGRVLDNLVERFCKVS